MLPELPAIDLAYTIHCPHCGDRVAGHLLREQFRCPHCNTQLHSNHKAVRWRALVIAALLYLGSTVLLWRLEPHAGWLIIAVVLGITLPILIGYSLFKYLLKIKIAEQAEIN
ncbi:MAG: hypothetical protein Tsb002_28550 [Wenzhouxiangellaceae bacterium]